MTTKYFMNGGVNANWSTDGNWSTTASAGPANTTKAIAGDVAIFDAGSPNCTIDTPMATATLTCTGYTNTFTWTSTLTTTATVTMPATMANTGAGNLISVTSSTLDIACTLSGGVSLGGTSRTYTLSRALTMLGTLTLNGTTGTAFSGNFLITAGAMSVTATIMALVMSGNITITGDVQWNSGTSTTITGSKAFLCATASVINSQTMTITSIGSMTVTGLTTSGTANVFNGGTWNTGGLTCSTGATTGTTVFNITGGTITLTTALSNSMTIAGDVTWASQTNLYAASGTPTLTYTSGTVTVGTSVLSIASSCTIVPSTTTFLFSLIFTAAATLTINTNALVMSGTLTMPNAAVTFAGGAGWTCATFTNTTITATRIWTFTAARTYTITGAFTTVSAAAQTVRFTMTAAATTSFVLAGGAAQDIGFVDPTNLDASLGDTIFTYHGVITTSTNWSNTLPVNALVPNAFVGTGKGY